MHYSYECTIEPANIYSAGYYLPVNIKTGILQEVKITFRSGCDRMIRVQIFDGPLQVLPQNIDGFYAEDGDNVVAPLYYDLDKGNKNLFIWAWNIGTVYAHIISVQFTVKAPNEPDLNSMVNLLADCMNRIVDSMRSMF